MMGIENDCLCHVSVNTVSAAKGNSAVKEYRYISRLDHTKVREDLVYSESINLPEFAKDNPELFWEYANKYESFHGRQAVLIEIALPRELDTWQNIALTKAFIREITTYDEGYLPCLNGIHYKIETNNPHFHALLYERPVTEQNKHHPPELFFKKANRKDASKGGAKKLQKFTERDFPKWLRKKWAEIANRFLKKFGSKRRMNPLSYKDRGLDITPQIHLGPKSSYNLKKGIIDERVKRNEEIKRLNARTLKEVVTDDLTELRNFFALSCQRDFKLFKITSRYNPKEIYTQATLYKDIFKLGDIEGDFEYRFNILRDVTNTYKKMQNIIYNLITEVYSKESIVKICVQKHLEYTVSCDYDLIELYELYEYEYTQIFERVFRFLDWRDQLDRLLSDINDLAIRDITSNEEQQRVKIPSKANLKNIQESSPYFS